MQYVRIGRINTPNKYHQLHCLMLLTVAALSALAQIAVQLGGMLTSGDILAKCSMFLTKILTYFLNTLCVSVD